MTSNQLVTSKLGTSPPILLSPEMGGVVQGRPLPIYSVFVLPSEVKGWQVGGWWGAGVWLLSGVFTDNVAALEPALCSRGLSFLGCPQGARIGCLLNFLPTLTFSDPP